MDNRDSGEFIDTDYHSFGESDDSLPSDSSSDLEMSSGLDEDPAHESFPSRISHPRGSERPGFGSLKPGPSMSGSLKPGPNVSGSFAPKQSTMCIVCGIRPRYHKGPVSYPTCGLTCAAKLEATTRDSGGSSSTKMCVVCGVRPRYSKGRKSYPTCGLTCAAVLNPPNNSAGMCDYCHRRPKFFDGRKVYPQCGRTCRDKARLAASRGGGVSAPPVSSSGTSTACLMCWRVPRRGDTHFCGGSCAAAAEHRAPLLLEAPRGHVTFKRVVDNFQSSWKKAGTPCPDVKKVYKVIEKPGFVAAYDNYRARINSKGTFKPPGNEQRLWYGTTRECNLGDPGYVKLCSSRTCLLCSAIRSSFDTASFPNGIHVSTMSNTSDEHSRNINRSPSKAMLFTNVIIGKDIKLPRDKLPPPHGYDSVQVVGSRNGKPVKLDEQIVYTGDAIRPSYLVVYG